MISRIALTFCASLGLVTAASAFEFNAIEGGTLDLDDWAGQPVLVVNTASLCGFTPQYSGLQALYDQYREAGLVVLAVPSDDFRQELDGAEEVKEFCEINYDLDLPMTDITHVRGQAAHPFYKWVAETAGFAPNWNFNKILLAPDGSVAATFGSRITPQSQAITGRIEAMIAD
ncbi:MULTISPECIES: glutathione peroxidase [unclassified Meridianimarinicoccus]|uniref:glutathione peroxidase n=1 Tax=unclassified Meridianimarinicoccus TaxID=2923344 RepID=UPI001867B454|nr:glutathione peroxidase [Fluviibacterium sp. MJW13]